MRWAGWILLGVALLGGCGDNTVEPVGDAPVIAALEAGISQIKLENEGWVLHGDWRLPARGAQDKLPAVLMLHKAAGSRAEYAALGEKLSELGVASLALDLRGHGDSTNLGRFEPPYAENRHINQSAYHDIQAALEWLVARQDVDPSRLAVIGASYSGEQVGIALREGGREASAYVMMSPGNFSDETIGLIDPSGADWLFVRTTKEGRVSLQFIDAVFEAVESESETAEVYILEGEGHASAILAAHPASVSYIADWIKKSLSDE